MNDHLSSRPIQQQTIEGLPEAGDGTGLRSDDLFYKEEVQSAIRNRGIPLEALRHPLTPTGLHYLIIHFDLPEISLDDWSLSVRGLVSTPLRLSLDDLRARPAVTMQVTMECAGNGRALLSPRSTTQPWFVEGVSTAEWTGTPLSGVLHDAGLTDDVTELVFAGLDWGVQGGEVQPFQRSLSLDEATRDDVLLAYDMNGEPLPPQHGYPLRLVVPDWYGMASVKWLASIEAIAEPFTGYQMTKSYRYSQDADDLGDPVTLKRPRALVVPPGIPDFASRLRIVNAGRVHLRGRAWSGRAGISRVEISTNQGASWADAELGTPVSELAWRDWRFDWDARPGQRRIYARATDDNGVSQPREADWNFRGMGNNVVYPIDVLVI